MRTAVLAVAVTIALSSVPAAPALVAQEPMRHLDVIYVATPQAAVDAMLQLADVTKNDVVYDLGCGDGRIPVTAARVYGARGVCIDLDPERIAEANENVRKNGVSNLVRTYEGDLFQQDLSPASVVTLFLLPSLNVRLMPKLMHDLKPGSRVVSYWFDMGDWKPEKELDVEGRKIYLWTIPKK